MYANTNSCITHHSDIAKHNFTWDLAISTIRISCPWINKHHGVDVKKKKHPECLEPKGHTRNCATHKPTQNFPHITITCGCQIYSLCSISECIRYKFSEMCLAQTYVNLLGYVKHTYLSGCGRKSLARAERDRKPDRKDSTENPKRFNPNRKRFHWNRKDSIRCRMPNAASSARPHWLEGEARTSKKRYITHDDGLIGFHES